METQYNWIHYIHANISIRPTIYRISNLVTMQALLINVVIDPLPNDELKLVHKLNYCLQAVVGKLMAIAAQYGGKGYVHSDCGYASFILQLEKIF